MTKSLVLSPEKRLHMLLAIEGEGSGLFTEVVIVVGLCRLRTRDVICYWPREN